MELKYKLERLRYKPIGDIIVEKSGLASASKFLKQKFTHDAFSEAELTSFLQNKIKINKGLEKKGSITDDMDLTGEVTTELKKPIRSSSTLGKDLDSSISKLMASSKTKVEFKKKHSITDDMNLTGRTLNNTVKPLRASSTLGKDLDTSITKMMSNSTLKEEFKMKRSITDDMDLTGENKFEAVKPLKASDTLGRDMDTSINKLMSDSIEKNELKQNRSITDKMDLTGESNTVKVKPLRASKTLGEDIDRSISRMMSKTTSKIEFNKNRSVTDDMDLTGETQYEFKKPLKGSETLGSSLDKSLSNSLAKAASKIEFNRQPRSTADDVVKNLANTKVPTIGAMPTAEAFGDKEVSKMMASQVQQETNNNPKSYRAKLMFWG